MLDSRARVGSSHDFRNVPFTVCYCLILQNPSKKYSFDCVSLYTVNALLFLYKWAGGEEAGKPDGSNDGWAERWNVTKTIKQMHHMKRGV